MSVSTAALHVFFNVHELLEHILLQLPVRDILLAQRVCKLWHALIATSPALQAALCFRPSRSVPKPPLAAGKGIGTVNPLIESSIPFLLLPTWGIPESQRFGWKREVSSLDHPPQAEDEWFLQKFWYSKWLFNEEAWGRKEASWRRMHVTEEPIRRVVFSERRRTPHTLLKRECTLHLGEPSKSETRVGSKERLETTTPTAREDIPGYIFCEPSVAEQHHGWLKINDRFVDLGRLDSLPMALVYDYLNLRVCRSGDPPAFKVSFHTNFPSTDRPDEFVVKSDFSDYAGSLPDRSGRLGDGLSMVVFMEYDNRYKEHDENRYIQFSSTGILSVEVGPWFEQYKFDG